MSAALVNGAQTVGQCWTQRLTPQEKLSVLRKGNFDKLETYNH